MRRPYLGAGVWLPLPRRERIEVRVGGTAWQSPKPVAKRSISVYNGCMEDEPREAYRPWRNRDGKSDRGRSALKQLGILVGINAVVALVISVIVTLTLGPRVARAPAPPPTATQEAAAAQATRTPTPAPGEETVYVVKPGDSLSAIAFQYGISLEELMAANDLTDPDVLYVGQRLVIPVPGSVSVPSATSPPTTAPTAGATVAPTNTRPTGPDLRIESVHVSPEGGDSYIVITNWGTWVRLRDWTLDDGQGNTYTFPDLSLFQGGSVRVHTSTGTNTEADLYWGTDQTVFVPGRTISLKDDAGAVATTYTIP